MPAGKRIIAMKRFGTALLSLALFSLCCVSAEETTTNISTQKTTGSSPSESKPVSTESTIFSSVTTNTTKPKGDTVESTSSTNSTNSAVHQTLVPTSVANGTVITGTVGSPAQMSVTSASSLTRTTAGQNDKTIAGNRKPQESTASTPQEPTATTNYTKNTGQELKDDASYSGIILPVIIALIVITLTVFLLMALYRMCFKTTPDRQESGTEQAPSDKENVKLISVKTTSPEAGEQSSQGKNKTRQHNDSSSHLGNKRV